MQLDAIKKKIALLSLPLLLTSTSQALPLIDSAIRTGPVKLQVFRDDQIADLYWYVPNEVLPVVTHDGEPQSEVFTDSNQLVFMYRGQASVDENTLSQLAENLKIPRSNLKPIFYNTNTLNNAGCANILFEPDEVKWMIPSQMGNFMEIFGMGLRTKKPELMPMLKGMIEGKGLNCVYTYKFSAVYSAYRVHATLDLNRVYERFQAESHAEGFWWEADIKTFFEKLRNEGYFVIKQYGDSGELTEPTEAQMRASFNDFVNKVITAVFQPTLKIHNENTVGRGRPWSIRADFRRQAEYNHYEMDLDSQKVKEVESAITVRMAIK